MRNNRRLIAVDCETDPAKFGRIPKPFLWGVYDGTLFRYFRKTEDFVAWLREQDCLAYAHNGGKFDFMYLVPYITELTKAQVINGRLVKLNIGKAQIRDSLSIIPEALKSIGKKDIDYNLMEADVREQHMDEIISYCKQDCISLYDLVSRYRMIGGKQTTIASNALRFCKSLGINPGKTSKRYDDQFRPFFYGGHCEVFKEGTHKNIKVIDIHSAYPYAMTHDHCTGNQYKRVSAATWDKLPRAEQQRGFVRLKCRSYGAFCQRMKTELLFPIGNGEFYTTGWEYVAAKELGLLDDVEIISGIVHFSVINFTPYVTHWYDLKKNTNKKTNPIDYTIAKIFMNSLFGKLAQDPTRYHDYKIVPDGAYFCNVFTPTDDKKKCKDCGLAEREHGYLPYIEFDRIQVFRRSTVKRYKELYGDEWEGVPIFNNVATGASITGFTRAHLMRAIHTIGREHIIYCDTDSLIFDAAADLSGISFSDQLGDWADEGTAEIGHFAGKKLYGLKFPNNEVKIASKGVKVNWTDLEAIMGGKIIEYRREFPSFSVAGEASFVVRNIRQTAKAVQPN